MPHAFSVLSQFNRVQVHRLSPELWAIARTSSINFNGLLCDSNSLRLVRALTDQSTEHSCALVAGFALPPKLDPYGVPVNKPKTPRAHVWIRFNGRDYDPTWEKSGWPVETLKYYEAFFILPADLPQAPEPNSGALLQLGRLAGKIRLNCY